MSSTHPSKTIRLPRSLDLALTVLASPTDWEEKPKVYFGSPVKSLKFIVCLHEALSLVLIFLYSTCVHFPSLISDLFFPLAFTSFTSTN